MSDIDNILITNRIQFDEPELNRVEMVRIPTFNNLQLRLRPTRVQWQLSHPNPTLDVATAVLRQVR